MRKVQEVLRLTMSCGLSVRQVAASCGIGKGTVGDYLRRAHGAGLSWPLPEGLDEEGLEALLFPPVSGRREATRAEPDWPVVKRELRRKGVTLSLLWQEYRAQHPEGYQYSRFCERYAEFA